MSIRKPLASLHVLVTRPAGLAEPLCNEIETLGGTAMRFPVIEISSLDNDDSLCFAAENVSTYDIAIFISPTAVQQTAKHIPLSSLKMIIAAIGEATASALEKQGLAVQLKSSGNNSEALLQHPLLQDIEVKNKHIIIFKGEGGRDVLTNTLSSRGAKTFCANIYKRIIPTNYTPLKTSTLQHIDVVLISSGEGIYNLLNMVEEAAALKSLDIIVPGERCAAIAKALGFKSIFIAENATNLAFISALCGFNKRSL